MKDFYTQVHMEGNLVHGEGGTGPSPPPGDEGAPGEDGAPGPPGERGPTGPTGPQGPAGSSSGSGVQGPPGEDGVDGDPGPPGPPGDRGATGATGSTGAAGAAGAAGSPGPPGDDGIPGEDGVPGPPGPTGQTGATGPQGPAGSGSSAALQGPPGEDAEPCDCWLGPETTSLDQLSGTSGIALNMNSKKITKLADGSAVTDAATINNINTVVINPQAGTSYTLILSDAGKLIECNNASPFSLTIPSNASVAFPVGTQIQVISVGVGQTTVGINTDSLFSTPGAKLRTQYSMATLTKITSTGWVLAGDISA